MSQFWIAAARSLIAVELAGEPGYLETLPTVRHLSVAPDGRVLVCLDDSDGDGSELETIRPDRPADVEMHGDGAMPWALLEHPRARHVEAFFDGLGDPQAAPLGWWHARVWLKAA